MPKLNSFKPNKPVRGFTLIELLVVIAILGILSALLLPVLSKAKNRASQVTDLNNLKEQTTALNLYCSDHDDIIPWPNWDGGNYDRQGWLYKADVTLPPPAEFKVETNNYSAEFGRASGAVINALGIQGLRIGPQIDPGVPWTESIGGPRLALALKSGNFGTEDFFQKALEMLP